MKRLNALALYAVMAPAYALGIGSVTAAEHDANAATQQEARQSLADEDNPVRNDTSSTGTAEALEGSGTAAARDKETEQTGEPYAAAQDAKQSAAEEGDPAMNETASGAPAEAAEGSAMVDAANEEAQELGGTDSADMAAGDMSGDAEPAFHAADLIGKDVISRSDDAKIGSIRDLVFGADGQILSVIVGVGGFLGMGDKDVAIAWSEVERQLNADGDDYVISVDRDSQSLKDATAYDRSLAHSTSIN